MELNELRRRGFDRSRCLFGNYLRLRCSQCEAVFLNGVPCHEFGCPNATGECTECGGIVPKHIRMCDECRGVVDVY